MKIASVAEIKSRFSAFLKASEAGPVVVTRNGRPAAVIIAVQDEDEIERLLMAYSPHLRAILDRSRQQFRDGEWLSEEEFWSQFKDAQPAEESAKPKKKRLREKGKGRQKGPEVEATQLGPEDKKVEDKKG
jgi:prevent-host-death family protein